MLPPTLRLFGAAVLSGFVTISLATGAGAQAPVDPPADPPAGAPENGQGGPADAAASKPSLPGKPSEAWAKRKADWPWLVDRDAWRALSLTERHATREEQTARVLDVVRQAVEKPWRAKLEGQFLVWSNCDKKFTKLAVGAANEFTEWCHAQFDTVSDELVRRRILQVLDPEDPHAYPSLIGRGTWRGLELDFDRIPKVQRSSNYGNAGNQYGGLFRDLLDLYLMDKDALLYRYLPGFLASGLGDCVGSAFLKSRKLNFRADDFERDEIRLLGRNATMLTFREILELDDEAYRLVLAGTQGEEHQFTKLVRYVTFGPGRKKAPTKGFLVAYMQAVVQAADGLRVDWDPAKIEARTGTKDELTEWTTLRYKEWAKRRDQVSARAFEIVCGEWTEKDWRSLEKGFAKYEVR